MTNSLYHINNQSKTASNKSTLLFFLDVRNTVPLNINVSGMGNSSSKDEGRIGRFYVDCLCMHIYCYYSCIFKKGVEINNRNKKVRKEELQIQILVQNLIPTLEIQSSTKSQSRD